MTELTKPDFLQICPTCLSPCSFLLLPRVPTHPLMDPPPSRVAGAAQFQYTSHDTHLSVASEGRNSKKGEQKGLDLLHSLQKLSFLKKSKVFENSGAKLSRTGKGRQRDLGQTDCAAPKGIFCKTSNLNG